MKRSGFKPKPEWKRLTAKKPLARGTSKLAPVGQRGKRMRQGKVAPNVQEQAWMDAIVGFGCIVCWLHYAEKRAAEIHHIKEGDRRLGHLFSMGLCYGHHRGGSGAGRYISRHPWKRRFEAMYGTEMELLIALRQIIEDATKKNICEISAY